MPALVGAEDVVVLDPVALEEPDGAVVHPHREVDDDLVLRLAEDRPDVGVELDRVGRAVELRGRHLVEVQMLLGLETGGADRRSCCGDSGGGGRGRATAPGRPRDNPAPSGSKSAADGPRLAATDLKSAPAPPYIQRALAVATFLGDRFPLSLHDPIPVRDQARRDRTSSIASLGCDRRAAAPAEETPPRPGQRRPVLPGRGDRSRSR